MGVEQRSLVFLEDSLTGPTQVPVILGLVPCNVSGLLVFEANRHLVRSRETRVALSGTDILGA